MILSEVGMKFANLKMVASIDTEYSQDFCVL
jgi:hypothetical protein